MPSRRNREPVARTDAGFSLIEIMIAVAIVAILAAVAYPTYLDSVRKGRRSEAVSTLSSLQQAEERYRANKSEYTQDLADLVPGLAASTATMTTANGYYTIQVEDADATSYILKGVAVAGTSQAGDTHCTTLRLQLNSGVIGYYGCNGCAKPVGACAGPSVCDPKACWAR
jgi:type IV pilus assembly protein PilE